MSGYKIIEPTVKHLSGISHSLFNTELGPLDVLAVIEEGQAYEDLMAYTVEIEFKGHIIHVLTLKKLVELKRTSNHPKDKLRLPVLEETLRQSNAKQD